MLSRIFTLFAMVSAILLGLLPFSPAQASGKPDAVVRVEMLLDCAGLDDDAFQYAVDQGYCERPGEGASAKDVQWGVCGFSYISIYNEGSGVARWEYGYGSIVGVVYAHELTVRWTNYTTDLSGSFWDDTKEIPSPAYNKEASRSVGSGEVITSLWGTAEVIWGGTCYMEVPTAQATIT